MLQLKIWFSFLFFSVCFSQNIILDEKINDNPAMQMMQRLIDQVNRAPIHIAKSLRAPMMDANEAKSSKTKDSAFNSVVKPDLHYGIRRENSDSDSWEQMLKNFGTGEFPQSFKDYIGMDDNIEKFIQFLLIHGKDFLGDFKKYIEKHPEYVAIDQKNPSEQALKDMEEYLKGYMTDHGIDVEALGLEKEFKEQNKYHEDNRINPYEISDFEV